MDKRQEIFEKVEDIFQLCNRRNKGFNETELDTKETITDYIYKNFSLKGVLNCKITVLVTYIKWEEAPHVMLDDYKHKITKIVEVDKLTDVNRMFTNLIDVKILK